MLKRLFDVVASLLGLLFLSPLLLVIAIAIRLDTPGPVLYRATRVGRNGDLFKLYKFRTMVINADQVGPKVTGASDARITSIGRFLRRTKLDELPQLINVLQGTMSIVGPRPEDPYYVSLHTDEQRRVLAVRPGITSSASIVYRHEQDLLTGEDWEQRYINIIMPAKLRIDLEYATKPSFWRDIRVIWRTFMALWR